MDILWLTNIMLPEFAGVIGAERLNQGGWLPSLIEALRCFAPDMRLTVACDLKKRREAVVRGVRYVGFPYGMLREYLDECGHRFDLVHIHGTEGCWAALPERSRARLATVASLQGIINGYYPHYTGNLLPDQVRTWRNWANILLTHYTVFRGGAYWKNRLARSEARAFGSLKHFMGRTEWDLAWTRFLAPAARYFVVGEVMRPPFYAPPRTRGEVVPHTIYCGAAFSYPLKGGHWLLRAVADLKRRFPDIRLRVANAQKVHRPNSIRSWIRQGEYHRYLCRLIQELDLGDCVDLLPSLDSKQVRGELARAEVFCLPSLCENSPNSLAEAMLTGCPAVATGVGGVASVMNDGETGLVVPSADPAMLSHKIAYLFEHPDVAGVLATRAREFAEKRYDRRTVVNQLLTAYAAVREDA